MESNKSNSIKESPRKNDLSSVCLADLWNEIGKRLNIGFGKIQMSFHNGKPSTYANLDLKIKTDDTAN